jgi:hypothetical protein
VIGGHADVCDIRLAQQGHHRLQQSVHGRNRTTVGRLLGGACEVGAEQLERAVHEVDLHGTEDSGPT